MLAAIKNTTVTTLQQNIVKVK